MQLFWNIQIHFSLGNMLFTCVFRHLAGPLFVIGDESQRVAHGRHPSIGVKRETLERLHLAVYSCVFLSLGSLYIAHIRKEAGVRSALSGCLRFLGA